MTSLKRLSMPFLVALVAVVPGTAWALLKREEPGLFVQGSRTTAQVASQLLIADCPPIPTVHIVAPGYETAPQNLVLADAGSEGGLGSSTWTTPEPEGGVVANSDEFRLFIDSFVEIELTSSATLDNLPKRRVPWWGAEAGFPVTETGASSVLGNYTLTTLFDGTGVEPWMVVEWEADKAALQLFSRGLSASEAVSAAELVIPDGIDQVVQEPFEPSGEDLRRTLPLLGTMGSQAVEAAKAAGLCVGVVEDPAGNAAQALDKVVVGIRYLAPGQIAVVVSDG